MVILLLCLRFFFKSNLFKKKKKSLGTLSVYQTVSTGLGCMQKLSANDKSHAAKKERISGY